MTENEQLLIKELEAKGLLPWEPGMMAICPDGDHHLVIYVNESRELLKVDSFDSGLLQPKDCTHAPCDALVGWLVGQLQAYGEGQPHRYLHINDSYGVHVRAGEVWGNGVKSVSVSGDTFLEALLRAFKAKWEAEHGSTCLEALPPKGSWDGAFDVTDI